ncbi:MAG: outer membrane beta-barrel family protein, partial [Bacteroidota bacterium]
FSRLFGGIGALCVLFHLIGLRTTNAQALTPTRIQATIVDDALVPVATGNVYLLSPEDSTLIKGGWFVSGAASISSHTPPPYLVKIKAMGYKAVFVEVSGGAGIMYDMGEIVLTTKLIQGVDIVANQSLIQRKGDAWAVNVEGTALRNAGSAMDVLRNSPQLLVNSGGQISVVGKGAALIYMNGQLIPGTQVLESLSSQEIVSVEIWETPPAGFDAAGNAVINIITRRKISEGYKLTLLQEVGHGKHWRGHSRVRGSAGLGPMELQLSYGFRPWTRGGREHYFRIFSTPQTQTEVDNRLRYARRLRTHDLNAQLGFQLGTNTQAGIQYTGQLTHGEKTARNQNDYLENGVKAFQMQAQITGPYDQHNHSLQAYLTHQIDTSGTQLKVAGQYSRYFLDRSERINQQILSSNQTADLNKKTYNLQGIDVYTLQTDLSKPVKKRWNIQAGAKASLIGNQSLLDFSSVLASGELKSEPALSNRYNYKEQIIAAYAQTAFQGKRLRAQVGLRGEWTKTNGVSEQVDGPRQVSRSYANLFPTASITQDWNETYSSHISYGYRIQRPQFQDL